MEISSEYLADLLIGIAKAQAAVIDAMERANPGFRNTHAVPLLQVAANLRAGDARLIDLPARVLLRMQGRVALENAAVVADLERLAKGGLPVSSDASAATAPRIAPSAPAPSAPAPAAPAPAAPTPAARAPAAPAPTAPASVAPAPAARAPAAPAPATPAPAAPAPAARAPAAPAPAAPASGASDLDFSAKP